VKDLRREKSGKIQQDISSRVASTLRFSHPAVPHPVRAGAFLEQSLEGACTLPDGLKFRSMETSTLPGLLKRREPFTFVRLGDGDWFCSLGGNGADSNGVELEKEQGMCDELLRDIKGLGSARDANLFVVVGTFFLCKETNFDMFAHVDSFFYWNRLRPGFLGFVNSNDVSFYFPLLPSRKSNRCPSVLPALQRHIVVLVGPKYLGNLQFMLNYTAHVEVPLAKGWESRNDILSGIRRESQRHPNQNVVFLVAAGVAARPILFRTYSEFGQKDTFIDVGSSLDGYAGKATRDYNSDRTSFCQTYPEYVADRGCVALGYHDVENTCDHDFDFIPEEVSPTTTSVKYEPVDDVSASEEDDEDEHDDDETEDRDEDQEEHESKDDEASAAETKESQPSVSPSLRKKTSKKSHKETTVVPQHAETPPRAEDANAHSGATRLVCRWLAVILVTFAGVR